MKLKPLTLILVLSSSSLVYGQSTSEKLPQLLETDAATVMTRGMTYDFGAKICGRLGNQSAEIVRSEEVKWRKRNDIFFQGASSALNEISERYISVDGKQSKQGYIQSMLISTTKEANKQLMRQLNGATLDNNIVPPETACNGLSRLLHDGVSDFKNTPEITQALVPYMQQHGILPAIGTSQIATTSRDASTAYIGTVNFVVGRVGRDCLSQLGRKDSPQEFVEVWQQRNSKYLTAAGKYMDMRLKEAQAAGGIESRDALLKTLTSAGRNDGESIVKSWLDRGDKVEACKRAIGLIESGLYDISASTPMFAELESLVMWYKN